jgi:AraC-like DNA-binding protein
VASHVRFTDAEAMTDAMKWGVGMTPGRARDRMGPDEFVARLAERVAPTAAQSEPNTRSWTDRDERWKAGA